MKKLCRFFLVVLALITTDSLRAQTSYGTVAGAVTDPTGAVVPGATVTVTSNETGETRTDHTTHNGGYRVESLNPGIYTITVNAEGFAKTIVASVTVSASVTTSVNPILKMGQQTQTVEVTSTNEVMQTESGEVSSTVSSQAIENLPISSMNPYALVTTLPGVVSSTTANFGDGASFSVNGTRPRANNFLIEGQDNNDVGVSGSGLTPKNQEAVENVTFLLNSASAEFGHGGGAVSNLVYKSGTNQFHGAIWDRLYNSSLNATDHSVTFNHGVKAKTRENVYGFRIGGPIKRDKAFFFASYEWTATRQTANFGILSVPTAAGYAVLNNLSRNPQVAKLIQAYAGLTADPTKFTTQLKTIALGADPVTGIDRGNVQYGGYQRTGGVAINTSEMVIKGDYLATSKDKLQLRFVRAPNSTPYDIGNNPNQLPHFDTQFGGGSDNAGIVENHTFSPKIFNELRLSWTRVNFLWAPRPDSYANPLFGPTVSISNVQGYGIPTSYPTARSHNAYQLQDALSLQKGNHSLKLGFDLSQTRVLDISPSTKYGSVSYVNQTGGYSALANFIDDYSGTTGANTTSVSKTIGDPNVRPTLTDQAYYVQDHWKIKSNLALDLGLRYEYYGAPFNYLQYPALDLSNINCFQCVVKEKPMFMNFGPRMGFAYTPGLSSKTVIRGGMGLFYDNAFTNIDDNVQGSSPNSASAVTYNSTTGRGTANWSQQVASITGAPALTNSQTSIPSNLKNPLTYQWNLAVQRELPYAMSVTVGYVGSHGIHLYANDNFNPLVLGLTTRVYPTRSSISLTDNSGDSEYNGGTLELERKYRTGALFRISYTYSKVLDDASEIFSSGNINASPQVQVNAGGRGLDWGPSAYDHRQSTALTVLYNIPKVKTSFRPLAAVVNGYTISSIVSFESGNPYNILSGIDINGDGINNDRPVLSNRNAPLNTFAFRASDFPTISNPSGAAYCDGTYYTNALAKNPVTGSTTDNSCHPVDLSSVHFYVGNRYMQNQTISRDASYARGLFNADAIIMRHFKIHESHGIDFRAECYNFLNHANTGTPAFTLVSSGNQPSAPGYLGATTFGNYATSTSGARNLRFFMKYSF